MSDVCISSEFRIDIQQMLNMKKSVILILVSVCISAICTYASPVFNVRDYGAKGNGKVLDHMAINRAIDDCVKNGGGC